MPKAKWLLLKRKNNDYNVKKILLFSSQKDLSFVFFCVLFVLFLGFFV